jgi:phosphoenolpyruvate carboxykinase (ATP)
MCISLRFASDKAACRGYACRALFPKTPSPRAQLRVIFVPREPTGTPSTQTRTTTQSALLALACPRPSIARRSADDVVTMASSGIKAASDPVIPTASPAPLTQDFARQQVSKQQRSNFHSSSTSPLISYTMVSQSVNKTNLHPSGVASVASLPQTNWSEPSKQSTDSILTGRTRNTRRLKKPSMTRHTSTMIV